MFVFWRVVGRLFASGRSVDNAAAGTNQTSRLGGTRDRSFEFVDARGKTIGSRRRRSRRRASQNHTIRTRHPDNYTRS